jgi:hypothetical protein
MLSGRRGGLSLVENKQKADPSCRLQQGLQIEIGTSLRSGLHGRSFFSGLNSELIGQLSVPPERFRGGDCQCLPNG